MIIDGKDLILGRLGTFVTKKAMLGEKVYIVNCEKIMISGKKKFVLSHYQQRMERGTHKGPFTYRRPEMFVRRALRGMIPYRKEKGKKAYANIRCYRGIPEEMEKEKIETIEFANIKKIPSKDMISVKDVCLKLGAKI